jgi:hypothetical protein
MVQANLRHRRLLSERNISVPELHMRIRQRGMQVNLNSLYRAQSVSRNGPISRRTLSVARRP